MALTLPSSGLAEDIPCVFVDPQGMEKKATSPALTRNAVSSKMRHCEASQKGLDAVPECFGVYLTCLNWSVTQLAAQSE